MHQAKHDTRFDITDRLQNTNIVICRGFSLAETFCKCWKDATFRTDRGENEKWEDHNGDESANVIMGWSNTTGFAKIMIMMCHLQEVRNMNIYILHERVTLVCLMVKYKYD